MTITVNPRLSPRQIRSSPLFDTDSAALFVWARTHARASVSADPVAIA
jgi:hypothetical protein